MKLIQIFETTRSPKWLEGYYAYWDGKRPETCPYEDEESRGQWTNGWQYGSQEE